jgi:hypothetical protein
MELFVGAAALGNQNRRVNRVVYIPATSHQPALTLIPETEYTKGALSIVTGSEYRNAVQVGRAKRVLGPNKSRGV